MVKKLVTVGAVAVGAGFYLKKKYGEKIHRYAVDAASKIVDKEFEKSVREYNEYRDDAFEFDEDSVPLDEAIEEIDAESDKNEPQNIHELFEAYGWKFPNADELKHGVKEKLASTYVDADNDISLYELWHGITDNFEDLTETVKGHLPEVMAARPEYALDLDTLLWLRKEFNLSDKVIDDILEEGVDTFEVLPVIVPKDVYVDAAVLYAGDNTEHVYQDASKVFHGDEK